MSLWWYCSQCAAKFWTLEACSEHREDCDDYKPCPGCGAEFDSAETRDAHNGACDGFDDPADVDDDRPAVTPEPNRNRGYDGTGQSLAADYTRGTTGRL